MIHRIRVWRPSHTTVAAYLALFVALGGTSYAATKLPKNSVGSSQLKKNAVTSSKVKNGALAAADFKAGQLPAGPQGPKGADGKNGTNGTNGAPGTVGAATVQTVQAPADLNMGEKVTIQVFCPVGMQAIGGGGRGDDTQSEKTNVGSSRPAVSEANTNPPANDQGFTGWRLTANNTSTAATTGVRPQVWVVCVDAPGP
jgi:hypothetical protein